MHLFRKMEAYLGLFTITLFLCSEGCLLSEDSDLENSLVCSSTLSEVQQMNQEKINEKKENETEVKMMDNLLNKRYHFLLKEAIEIKNSWNITLSFDLLDETFTEDVKLYENETQFTQRRDEVKMFSDEEELKRWPKLVLKAIWEIATGHEEEATKHFRRMGLFVPLLDFVQHIHFFEMVKSVMIEKGEQIYVFGNNYSCIHDIDKVHPLMLAGYAEKFDDGKDTLLWKASVDNHIQLNPHHQGYSVWNDTLCEADVNRCEEIRHVALNEMICDKVARKVQKELNGKICEDMWNVDMNYFEGLPAEWLQKAAETLKKLKHSEL